MHTTIISVAELAGNIHNPDWAIIDCRFSSNDSERGRRDYLHGHIPGSVYAHVEEDLSGPFIPNQTGRYPLPPVDALTQKLSSWGIDSSVQVVIYDDMKTTAAARLWLLLRWLGHDAVAVLDGGWPQWQQKGYPVQIDCELRPFKHFLPRIRPELILTTPQVQELLHNPNYRLFDSRSVDRYRGENENLYPIAGHIPGAQSADYLNNVDSAGLFRPMDELRSRFQSLLAGTPAEHVIFYCGAGISSANNVLALTHAGLGSASLYLGSWSEWIADPSRPVQTGSETG